MAQELLPHKQPARSGRGFSLGYGGHRQEHRLAEQPGAL